MSHNKRHGKDTSHANKKRKTGPTIVGQGGVIATSHSHIMEVGGTPAPSQSHIIKVLQRRGNRLGMKDVRQNLSVLNMASAPVAGPSQPPSPSISGAPTDGHHATLASEPALASEVLPEENLQFYDDEAFDRSNARVSSGYVMLRVRAKCLAVYLVLGASYGPVRRGANALTCWSCRSLCCMPSEACDTPVSGVPPFGCALQVVPSARTQIPAIASCSGAAFTTSSIMML
jgi:hypothetical protein